MSGVVVRPMAAKDIPALALLEQAVFSDPWGTAAFEAELANPGGITLVAEKDSAVLGYLNAHHATGNVHINTFNVHPDMRRKGTGTALLRELVRRAQRLSAEEITLEVRAGNRPAVALYEAFGFVSVGVRKNFYREPVEDAKILKKEL